MAQNTTNGLLPGCSHDFFVELWSPPGDRRLRRVPLEAGHFLLLAYDVIWQAQREGIIGVDRSDVVWRVEPLFAGDTRRPQVRGVSIFLVSATSGAELRRKDFSLKGFQTVASDVVRQALIDRDLQLGSKYETTVVACEPQESAALPAVRVKMRETPLAFVPGRLDDWERRSELLNGEAFVEGDMPIYIGETTLANAREGCKVASGHEAGVFLVGRLHRQEAPEPAVFAVIEGVVKARHADEKQFSLTMTPETYRFLERQLEVRRKRLARPEEILLGTAHSHPFLPSLNEKGEPNCPSCSKRATCDLNSSFFSAADARYHAAMFARQPYALGLVWGLDPRGESVLKAFGFRAGVLEERAIGVVSSEASSVHNANDMEVQKQ